MSDDYEHTVWFGGLPSDIISGLHPQIVAEFLEDAKYGTVDRVEMKELCFLVRFERKIDAQKCAAKRRVNVRGHVAVVCMYEQAENRARQRRRSTRSRSISRSRSRRSRVKSRSRSSLRSRSDRRKATDRGRKVTAATTSLKVTNALAPRASLSQRYKPHLDDKVPIRAPPIPASDRQNSAAKPRKGSGKSNGTSGYVSGKGTNGLASEVIGHLKTLHDHLGRADLQRIELQLKRVSFSEQIQAMKTFLDSEPRELKNPVGWFQGILKSISMRAGNIPSIRGGIRASPRDKSHSQSSSSSSSPSRVVRRQVVRKVARSPSQRGRSRGSPRATKKPLRSWSQSAGSSRSSMKSWSQPVKQSVAKSSSESSSRSENNDTAEKKTAANNNVRAVSRVASPGSAVRRKRAASKESAKSSDLANWDDVTSQSSPVKKVEPKKVEPAVKVSKERVAIEKPEKPEKPRNKDKVNNYCFGTPIHVPMSVSVASKESKSAWGTWATQEHDTGVASSNEANENATDAAFPRRQVKLKPREAEVASSKDERKSRVVLKKAPQQEEAKSPEASEEKNSPDEENPEQEDQKEQEEVVLKKRRSSDASSSSQKSAEPNKSEEEPAQRNDAPEPDGQSGSSRSPSPAPLVLKEAKEATSNSKKPSDEAIRVAEQAEKQALAVLASEQLATEKGEESPSERIQRIKTALAATRKAAEALKASGEKPKAKVATKLPVKAAKPKTKVDVKKKKVVLPKAAEKRPLLAPESTKNKKKHKVEGKPLTLAEANKLVSLMFRSPNGTVKRVVHRGETTLAQIFESRGKDPRKYQFVFDGRKVSRKITVKELEDNLPKGSNGTVEIDWDKLIAVRLHVAQDVFEDNLPGQMTIQKLFVDLWERGVKETIEGLNCQNKAGVEFAGDLTLATLDTRYACSQNKKPLKLFITDSKWDSDCGF